MPTTNTATKTTTKKVFTRITLNQDSLQAVSRVQSVLPNYDLNDAVKMIFGLGLGQLDNVLPDLDQNGFNATTKAKLLKAYQSHKSGKSITVKNQEIESFLESLDD